METSSSTAGAASLFATAAEYDKTAVSSEFAAVSRALALRPSEQEYETIQKKIRELMEAGRGETIMELGTGEDTDN